MLNQPSHQLAVVRGFEYWVFAQNQTCHTFSLLGNPSDWHHTFSLRIPSASAFPHIGPQSHTGREMTTISHLVDHSVHGTQAWTPTSLG